MPRSNTFEEMNKRKLCFYLILGLLRPLNSIMKVDLIYSISLTLLSTLHINLFHLCIIRFKHSIE